MSHSSSPPPLTHGDIQNFDLLIERLFDESYGPSTVIRGLLPQDLLDRLREARTIGDLNPNLKSDSIKALNRDIVFNPHPLSTDDFAVCALTPDVELGRIAADYVNRRLLAEAYPASIQAEYSRTESPEDWFKYYIAKFKAMHDLYKLFAKALEDELKVAHRELAPLAIVQSRAKTVESFAEKVWRKDKYLNPLAQITDLCGARVITETDEETERICTHVRAFYEIDEANSDDARNRLSYTEFGYSAVHFIVSLDPGKGTDPMFYGLKGEIQVKTLLQHAWSSICHDRMYKSNFKVPDRLRRGLHRAAAILEESDQAFARAVSALDDYKTHYGAYMTGEEIKKEIQTQEAVLTHTAEGSTQQSVRLKIARLYKAMWKWSEVVAVLEPLLAQEHPTVLTEHGYALCRLHGESPTCTEYGQGIEELKHAKRLSPATKRTDLYLYLAWAYSNAGKHGRLAMFTDARDHYLEAYTRDSNDPYALACYVESEVYCERSRDFPRQMRISLLAAIDQCKSHILAGIEIPWAFFTIGRLYVLLKEYLPALNAYCKGISHYLNNDRDLPDTVLQDEREFLKSINFAHKLPEEDQWIDSMLLLALWLRSGSTAIHDELKDRRRDDLKVKSPILMVAGGTDDSVQARMQNYRTYLTFALQQFDGTVVSGGTTAGIPGLIGEIVRARNADASRPVIQLVTYLPKSLPTGIVPAPEYERHFTSASGFSVDQPIQAWIDLTAADIDPRTVLLLGINGGDIAAFEYQAALALGATVGLFTESGRAVSQVADDADWLSRPNLVLIPNDPSVAWAFVNTSGNFSPSTVTVDEAVTGAAAQAIHESYVEDNRDGVVTEQYPQFNKWRQLDSSYVASCKLQAKYLFTILASCGYAVQPAPKGQKPGIITFENEEAWKMAEMEHGRYVVERELAGWRYGTVRDNDNKRHPNLVAWRDLPDEAKNIDILAVKKWPKILAGAGLEIVEPLKSPDPEREPNA